MNYKVLYLYVFVLKSVLFNKTEKGLLTYRVLFMRSNLMVK